MIKRKNLNDEENFEKLNMIGMMAFKMCGEEINLNYYISLKQSAFF